MEMSPVHLALPLSVKVLVSGVGFRANTWNLYVNSLCGPLRSKPILVALLLFKGGWKQEHLFLYGVNGIGFGLFCFYFRDIRENFKGWRF